METTNTTNTNYNIYLQLTSQEKQQTGLYAAGAYENCDTGMSSEIFVRQNKKGELYVSHESQKGQDKDGKDVYFDVVRFDSAKEKQALDAQILARYQRAVEIAKNPPEISAKVRLYEKEEGSLKGYANVSVGSQTLCGFKIFEGKNGHFISEPARDTGRTDDNNKRIFKNQVGLTPQLRKKVEAAICAEYDKVLAEQGKDVSSWKKESAERKAAYEAKKQQAAPSVAKDTRQKNNNQAER